MHLIVIEPPKPIVTVDEAKKHLIVEHNDDDVLIEGLILAATSWLDGPDGWLGRALGVQTLELSGWFGCRQIELPCPPVIGAVQIVTEDSDGTQTVVDPGTYRLRDGCILVSDGAPWVTCELHRVRYQAGYRKVNPDNPSVSIEDVPKRIKVAIVMLVAQWFKIREPVVVGASVEALPFGVEQLLQPYRVYR